MGSFGRRVIMIFGCANSIFCMVLISYFSADLINDPSDKESAFIIIILIFWYIIVFAVSIGPAPWMINADILPP